MRSLLVSIVSLALCPTVWGHGLERHFGTAINGARAPVRGTPRASPAFSLLAIETTAGEMTSALREDRREVLPELASRLSSLVRELRESMAAGSGRNAPAMRARVASLDAGRERIRTALRHLDGAELERELAKLKDAALEFQRAMTSSP